MYKIYESMFLWNNILLVFIKLLVLQNLSISFVNSVMFGESTFPNQMLTPLVFVFIFCNYVTQFSVRLYASFCHVRRLIKRKITAANILINRCSFGRKQLEVLENNIILLVRTTYLTEFFCQWMLNIQNVFPLHNCVLT